MTQSCKVVFGNISKNEQFERVFSSKNEAFTWLNHQLVRQASFPSVHELFFRVESYDFNGYNDDISNFDYLPF